MNLVTKRQRLASVAEAEAFRPFHGFVMSLRPNLHPIVSLFPTWPLKKWDRHWCAAFVYYCCIKAGFDLPVRWPDERVPANFASCGSWLAWASLPALRFYTAGRTTAFQPEPGNLVLYDRVFDGSPRDHMGIVLRRRSDALIVAEGNFNNLSAVIERPRDQHIRGFIRIPNDFAFRESAR